MQKHYIVTNQKFLKEIDEYKKHKQQQQEFIKDFFKRYGIEGKSYYMGGDGFLNCPFEKRSREDIYLYIEDTDANQDKFGKQLRKVVEFGRLKGLRQFRKTSALLKEFQRECVEKKVVVNLRQHREGDYFEELEFGGYSVKAFLNEEKYYLELDTHHYSSITPKYEGFEEIKASAFYAELEKFQEKKVGA